MDSRLIIGGPLEVPKRGYDQQIAGMNPLDHAGGNMQLGATILMAHLLATSTLYGQSEQARPSFSGHWSLQPESLAANSGQIPPICRLKCVIKQDEKSLVFMTPSGETILSYRLDGIPIKSTQASFGQTVEFSETAFWEGASLVLMRVTRRIPGNASVKPIESRSRLSLVNDRLVFDRTMDTYGSRENAKFVYERVK
jgi:hypothetical protein